MYGENKQFRFFQILLRGRGILPVWAILGGGNLTRSDFDYLNVFQS